MASRVKIANLALTILGADRITSLDDNNENARRLDAIFDECLEDVLRAHPWNFAIVRLQLARLTTTPAFGYDYEFQVPSDCLRIIEVSDSTQLITDYKIEGRKLLCNSTGVYVKYIARVTDPGQYSSQFVFTLASRLAAELAYAITNNKSNAEDLFNVYQLRLQQAKETDAQESTAMNTVDADLWVEDVRA